nr:ATP-binding protein [Bacteroidota bacterium]
MKRHLYSQLIEWKNDGNRKPLLLQGARQVGKTYLVNEFGKKEYNDFVYLNFEQNPDLVSIFSAELNPYKIIENIGLYYGRAIKSENTLIFFDEIQIAPLVLTSLKYFQENSPEYHVVAAGSLLGVSVGKQSSFPVGKVNFMMLYPMSFFEYLTAFGVELMVGKLYGHDPANPLPEIIHEKLLSHLKQYLFLGGMPEVLQDYLENKNIVSARKIQGEILKAYERDFSKYTEKAQAIKTSEIWRSIPRQLSRENKKFKYSDVRQRARASTYEQTIEWLKKAGLINLTTQISTPKIPLSGYADYSRFKVYLLDSGLLGAMLDITSDIIIKPTALFSEYNGAFIENFVASELVTSGNEHLYYWSSNNTAEVDFIIQHSNKIFPVEVKSGLSKFKKSLQSYAEKYNPELMFRCSPRNFNRAGNFVNLPLYACSLVKNQL